MNNSPEQIRTSQSLVSAIVKHAPNGIIIVDKHGMIQLFNPKAEQLFAYTSDAVTGKNISMLMPELSHEFDDFMRQCQSSGAAGVMDDFRCELSGISKSNIAFPVELTVTAMQWHDDMYFLGFIHDITQLEDRKTKIEHMAAHDPVTGLLNDRELLSSINVAIDRRQPVAILYLGLERFHTVNEVLGHSIGNQVLAQVGKRLLAGMGGEVLIAHLSGSEFALLWPEPSGNIKAMAKLAQSTLVKPLKLKQFSIDIEASIGVVCHPDHGDTAEDLLRRAEIAMQAARRRQIMVAVYDYDMEQYQLEHLTLAGELRHAIEAGELVVYYQPKVDISSRTIFGVEALVRWIHPEKGMIQPDLFIPMAEETGIIHPFTAWLINETVRQIHAWQQAGIELVVAINLAPRNLLEADLPDRLVEAIRHWHIQPSQLMVEITERGLIAEPKRGMATLERIHQAGMPISIDDFGTGYSSLAYLKDMPVAELKIDQSFISAMGDDAASLTIVQMVVQMAHYLGLEVTAEGVETGMQWQRLELLGCERAQGYYMGRPMPADALERWLLESPYGLATGASERGNA